MIDEGYMIIFLVDTGVYPSNNQQWELHCVISNLKVDLLAIYNQLSMMNDKRVPLIL